MVEGGRIFAGTGNRRGKSICVRGKKVGLSGVRGTGNGRACSSSVSMGVGIVDYPLRADRRPDASIDSVDLGRLRIR